MGEKTTDLRVVKTRRGLRDAFYRLLCEKDYDDISIQDIATEAETARVTFYRHYKNKEELLIECLSVTSEEVKKRFTQVSELTPEVVQQGFVPMQVLFEHIQEEEQLYRILFSTRGTQVAVGKLRKFLADRVKDQIMNRFPAEQLLAPVEIIAYHFASAQLGLAAWWLENDMPYSPTYMAQISFWLNLAGIARGYGVEKFPLEPPLIPDILENQ
jgi:AcrR family transcriptional regulator